MAVAEKVEEHGQRSPDCVEGYLLFAKSIIGMLQAHRDKISVALARNYSASRTRRVESLRREAVWSRSSSCSELKDAEDEDEEADDEDKMSSDSSVAEYEGNHRMAGEECSDAEAQPEREAWRLLRRCEEILIAEGPQPSSQAAAQQLAQVRDLLGWFDAPFTQAGREVPAAAAPCADTGIGEQ